MFWTFKLAFDEDILGLAIVLATFSKIWAILPNLLVTMLANVRPAPNIVKILRP
jgi:hypothetical protein